MSSKPVGRSVFKLRGRVPNKKNELRRNPRGGMYYQRDKDGQGDTRAELDALILQARSAWSKVSARPAHKPQVSMLFVLPGLTGDPDNKQTAILDVLKKAGVIRDDNAKALTPPLVCNWRIVPHAEETTYVEIREAA